MNTSSEWVSELVIQGKVWGGCSTISESCIERPMKHHRIVERAKISVTCCVALCHFPPWKLKQSKRVMSWQWVIVMSFAYIRCLHNLLGNGNFYTNVEGYGLRCTELLLHSMVFICNRCTVEARKMAMDDMQTDAQCCIQLKSTANCNSEQKLGAEWS